MADPIDFSTLLPDIGYIDPNSLGGPVMGNEAFPSLPPSAIQRERNIELDDAIRRGMLRHKGLHSWDRISPSIRSVYMPPMPSYNPGLQAATGWTEPELNAALHSAGRTDYGGLLSPLIRLGTEFYTSTLDRPKDDEATPDLDESNLLKKDDIRDMWADEYSQELYDTGITTLQETLDKGIARPEDFSAGRNLPNEPLNQKAATDQYWKDRGQSWADRRKELYSGSTVTAQDAYDAALEGINPNPIGFVQSQADIQGAVDYLNQLKDATLRERAFEAARGNPLLGISSGMGGESGEGGTIIYEQQDVMPWGAGDEYMEAQGFVSNMPRPEAVNVDRPIYYTDSGPMPTEEQIDQSTLRTMEMVSKARDPKDAGQSSVVKALQQEQKKATQKVADLEKQQKDHRAKIDKGGESAEAAGKFEAKRLYNEHQAALASEKALKSQNTMATLLQAMNIQRSEELARRERDRLERERRARLYGDAFDPSGRR